MDINIKSLSAEQRQSLLEQLQSFKEPTKAWRAELSGDYWLIAFNGITVEDYESGHDVDNYRYLTGNYFKTKDEAQKHLDRQRAMGTLTHKINELNDGWVPNWSDVDECKHYIILDCNEDVFEVSCRSFCKYSMTIPYMKTKEIADKIIEDHQKDLALIFNA